VIKTANFKDRLCSADGETKLMQYRSNTQAHAKRPPWTVRGVNTNTNGRLA